MVIFHSFLYVYQRVKTLFWSKSERGNNSETPDISRMTPEIRNKAPLDFTAKNITKRSGWLLFVIFNHKTVRFRMNKLQNLIFFHVFFQWSTIELWDLGFLQTSTSDFQISQFYGGFSPWLAQDPPSAPAVTTLARAAPQQGSMVPWAPPGARFVQSRSVDFTGLSWLLSGKTLGHHDENLYQSWENQRTKFEMGDWTKLPCLDTFLGFSPL